MLRAIPLFYKAAFAVITSALLAVPQESGRPLTNADVSAMLKAKLPESTIANAIGLAARAGNTNFDTSPAALIELKNHGATAPVLNAMLYAQAFPKPDRPSTAVPGLPAERGVYYCEGGTFLKLPSTTIFPEINPGWRGMTPTEHRRYVIERPAAELTVREASPLFYVRGISSRRDWQLVKLEAKGDYRQWHTVKADMFREGPMQLREGPAPALEYRAVAKDVFELRPAAPLEPGQYAITMLAPGQRWLVVAYPFAVQ
ncbi:MAG TPA: hypothetical protein PLA43_11565 [Bryobacteraceae bacterium]|nr:hypothetical protein [Bryobacteraceae bacterium]HOQ46426.1 hypothetical protein [Bryobacteraceae bacterium]HPU72587.1 hypothetical protein [Bryobacteraceae bacterium]